jgi:uncharacterized protein
MTAPRFRPVTAFTSVAQGYHLLPFRFLRWPDASVLLTNECGEFTFMAGTTFAAFTKHELPPDDPTYAELKAKHFFNDTASLLPLELLATKVRTKRSYLTGFTRLHIVVTTLRCDHTCGYCQVSRVTPDRTQFDMSLETATRALNWVFQSPADVLKIEFQGGEPTLNWPVISHIVPEATSRAQAEGRRVEFVIATNLATITEEMLAFCKAYQIPLSTSLDGPGDLHNANRPKTGQQSYELFRHNLTRARAVLGHEQVAALMTTTPATLGRVREVIDEYVTLGFHDIFLRPISPYGFATRTRLDGGYDVHKFLSFYREGLDYIITLNRQGTPCVEVYAQILLRKMLTPFPAGYVDLQSPAGTAISVLLYNYNGDVYASDEGRMLAEMGDYSFRLGHVTDSYAKVMTGPRVRALVENTCLETMPGCTDCGVDPVFNWATQGDIVGHRPTSAFCARQMGILHTLFTEIRQGDAFVRSLFLRWATQ